MESIHLDGLALQWHLNYMRQKFDVYPTWNQYVKDVTTRFGDIYEDPLSSLIQIKHGGKIENYIDEFELGLTQVNLIPEHSLSVFFAGLDHTTQMQVRMFNPTTIAQAANLARLLEASKPTKPYRFTKPYNPYSKFQPSSSNPPTDNPPKPLLNKPQRAYNAIEMADRRVKRFMYVL